MEEQRTCEECGETFVAKHPAARFCSTAHRRNASRRPDKVGKAKAAGLVGINRAPEPEAPPVYDTLVGQVEADLAAEKALGTISGRAAIRIAQQLDRGRDTGSAVATLTKELTRLVESARVEAAPKIRDAVTELEEQATAKLRLVAGGA